MDISCIVLAGGKGSRLGYHKAQVIVGKKSLFQRVLCSISFVKGEIIIVTGGKERFPWLTSDTRYRVVTDIYPGRGPLVGIFTGLRLSKSLHNLVVASDMPFLNQALLSYMTRMATGFDLVIPRLGAMVEPLHAVYSKSCLAPIEQMIKEDNLSVYRLLILAKVRYLETVEIDRFDPEHLSVFNINTKAVLERAGELIGRKDIIDDKC